MQLFLWPFILNPIQAHAGQNILLAWDPSADGLAAGYNVYYGGVSGDYTNRLDVGNTTSVVISNLVPGTTYYFALTAYDSLGVESLLSNEVSYSVPSETLPPDPPVLSMQQTGATAGAQTFAISSGGTAPSQWALQASTDLISWNTITLGTNSLVNANIVVAASPQLFFRLNSDAAGVSLVTQTSATNAMANSFFITTSGATPTQWSMESSADLNSWNCVAAGTNTPVNIAVIISTSPQMFFRMKGG